jgi:hypothetical protein
VPVYNLKGDPMECGSYRENKLLEHAMKVVERVLDSRIREHICVDETQFRFRPGKGKTDAIFIVRQLQEKHQAIGKKLHYALVELSTKKAFNGVLREITRCILQKLGVEEWFVSTVMAMYEGG